MLAASCKLIGFIRKSSEKKKKQKKERKKKKNRLTRARSFLAVTFLVEEDWRGTYSYIVGT